MDKMSYELIALAYTTKTSNASSINDFLEEYQSNLNKIKPSEDDEWMV